MIKYIVVDVQTCVSCSTLAVLPFLNFIFILVPKVLEKCAEFIEERGIVDGIYRLGGVASNIQRLR